METRAHHLLIGLFTVFVVVSAIAFALWMGGSKEGRYKIYDVLFDEAVSGLSEGSTVEFKGIKVGSVEDLRLDPANPRRVRARIRVEEHAPIFTDTHARLHTTSITGLSVVRLTEGSGSPLEMRPGEIPVIPAELSPLSKLLDNSEDVITNANSILRHIQGLFSEDNIIHIDRTLANLELATRALAAGQEDIRQTLSQLSRASKDASVVLADASSLIQHADRLLDGPGQAVFGSAQRAMASLEHTTESLDKLLANNRTSLDTGLRSLADLGPAVTELRSTLASLRTIARRLEERPADYLLGLEPAKEFKR